MLYGQDVLQPRDPEAPFDMHRAMMSFSACLHSEYGISDPVFHVSLSPHPDDKLTDEQQIAIAQEYMERMGFGNQPYYVFRHRDIEREHLHLVSVRVDAHGKPISDSNDFKRSKTICEDLERKYHLIPAKGRTPPILDELKKVEYGKVNIKQQIASAVRLLTQQYKFGSLTELNTLLGLYNIKLEEIKGEAKGKPYHGIVYSATTDSGERIGVPVKSSRIGKDVGIKKLESRRQENFNSLTPEIRAATRDQVCRAMHSTRTKDEFVRYLKDRHIDAVIRENKAGRIYGMTFIDHNTRTVLNGSRLGKPYAADVFEQLFHNPQADWAALLPPEPTATKERTHPGQAVRQPTPTTVRVPRPDARHSQAENAPEIQTDKTALDDTGASLAGALDILTGALFDDSLSADELDQIRDNLQRKHKKKKKGQGIARQKETGRSERMLRPVLALIMKWEKDV